MAMIRGNFTQLSKELSRIRNLVMDELSSKRIGINEYGNWVGLGDYEMGGPKKMSFLDAALLSQSLQNQNHQNQLGQLLNQNVLGSNYYAGLTAQQGLQATQLEYPFLAPPQKALKQSWQDLIEPIAKEFGFEFDWDTGGWKSKYDGFVSRMHVEGMSFEKIREVFASVKCPNIAWLDKRIEEMRVRLI